MSPAIGCFKAGFCCFPQTAASIFRPHNPNPFRFFSREATALVNATLTSLNLPAAIDDALGGVAVPESVAAKASRSVYTNSLSNIRFEEERRAMRNKDKRQRAVWISISRTMISSQASFFSLASSLRIMKSMIFIVLTVYG